MRHNNQGGNIMGTGNGTSWKRRNRQFENYRKYVSVRQLEPRVLAVKPQYTLEDLYISPFRKRRVYNEDGIGRYEALEVKTEPTGIEVFDKYLNYLAKGNSGQENFASALGARVADIDSIVFLLTGMRGVDFRMAYQLRLADDLLRYTNLEMTEVGRRSGIGTPTNLYYAYKRAYNVSPTRRRSQLRKKMDLGRYIL